MKRKKNVALTDQKWDENRWRTRCAWCARTVKANDPVFAVSVRLHAAALAELEPGRMAPLFLPGIARVVPMIVVGADSPAKREGKDAVFRLCSEACAQTFQRVLREELGGAAAGQAVAE